MMENEIISLIGSLGFPIAICVFLLIERGKTLKELTKVIQELTILINAKIK
jgi:hypothetical protein